MSCGDTRWVRVELYDSGKAFAYDDEFPGRFEEIDDPETIDVLNEMADKFENWTSEDD